MTPILVVATIIFFLTVDWVVQRAKARKTGALAAPAPQAIDKTYPLRIPEGVFFARSHTWLNLFPSGKVRLGVDDFVGSVLDNPEVSFMRTIGEHIDKGDPLLMLSEGDRQLIIRSPISGEIIALNPELERNPAVMRKTLFSNGWAYTIQPKRAEEMRAFMLGEESRVWMGKEFRRLRDLLAGAGAQGALAPAALQDGGAPVTGVLRHLDASAWKKFEDEFLHIQ
jgi:glycine cleavage system H protein